ncbi:MAG: extracellular solute-binding protein [Rhodobacteraceae bacterium]|jgi:spermidine/putrescine transport system substrate-binding protein|nr:extracellular solute-binding protein [Paracoccaceae bacterium]
MTKRLMTTLLCAGLALPAVAEPIRGGTATVALRSDILGTEPGVKRDGITDTVPSHNFVPIFIAEGLLQPINVGDMAGAANLTEMFRNPDWDPGAVYTAPWQWGTTAYTVDTAVYAGDVDTYEVKFNPPAELQGSIGMFRSPDEVISMALLALGKPLCNENPDDMREVLELLQAQKSHVKVYNSDGILERLVSGDTALHQNWSGYSIRAREEKQSLRYAFPREGVIGWADTLAVPVGAQNPENAIRFIEFMLEPENAGLQSTFAGYANGITGSDAFMSAELLAAPEISPPDGTPVVFSRVCSEAAIELQSRVWTTLLQ